MVKVRETEEILKEINPFKLKQLSDCVIVDVSNNMLLRDIEKPIRSLLDKYDNLFSFKKVETPKLEKNRRTLSVGQGIKLREKVLKR